MDHFEKLGKQAAAKRDEAYAAARRAYREDIDRINELEESLNGGRFKVRPLGAPGKIMEVAPDEEFTVAVITDRLNAVYPDLEFKDDTIRASIDRLVKAGKLKRTRKGGGKRKSLFAHVETEVPKRAFADMGQADIAELLLQDGPKTALEIAIQMVEQGYETDSSTQDLVNTVVAAMKRHTARFVKIGKKWTIDHQELEIRSQTCQNHR